jgi:NADH dehydrogenase
VATQQGRAAAKNIARDLRAQPRPRFHYNNRGVLATIGRAAAVADFGRIHLSGFVAWLAWLFIHILMLIGFRNRLSVMLQWTWAYVVAQRGPRLITD